MISKFPFKDKVLLSLAYLNPQAKDRVSSEDVANLSERFMPSSPEQKSQLEDQTNDYLLCPDSELPKFDSENITLNQFWQSMGHLKVPGGNKIFGLLCELSKIMLTIPHSNADTERTFSMLNKIQTDCRDNLDGKNDP